jgi:hypothetical protein
VIVGTLLVTGRHVDVASTGVVYVGSALGSLCVLHRLDSDGHQ